MAVNIYGQDIGDPVPSWTPPSLPPRAPLVGSFCQLEPLLPAHADDLFTAFQRAPDGRDWTYLPVERIDDREAYRRFVETQAASADPLHHAIVVKGQTVGTAAFMRMDPGNGAIEIGYIAFSPSLQRTREGTEAVYLLLARAFDELGYRRVEWKCDSFNAPSRRAALRYGFVFEGIFRQAVVTKGRSRDTAWFAMTCADWRRASKALRHWLAPQNFDARGVAERPLSAFKDEGT